MASLLAERKGVRLAYVFGSTARGDRKGDSDIDLAVLFDVSPSANEQLVLRETLAAAAGIPVDLIDLNAASPLLAHEVIREGKAIVAHGDDERAAFELRTIAKYLDTVHLRNVQLGYFRERARARAHAG